jgi:DNA-binding NarL/FixJ family response regulator
LASVPGDPLGGGTGDGHEHVREEDLSNPTATSGITARELEVWMLLATGMSNKQIAVALRISRLTVRNHVNNLYLKLGVHDRMAAALEAFRGGLIKA